MEKTTAIRENELQYLKNALASNNLKGYTVHEYLNGRGRSTGMYFLVDDKGTSLTGHWKYEHVNHFIMGYGKAFKKANPPTQQSNTVGEYENIKLAQDKNHVIDADRPGLIIASCNLFRKTPEATAARIVECWNGYDELKRQLDWWHKMNDEDIKMMARWKDENEKAKADNEALKEARSESMKHIATLNGEVTELKEANIELVEMVRSFCYKANEHQMEEGKIMKGYTLAANIPGLTELVIKATRLLSKHSVK